MNIVPCIKWIRRGVSKSVPDRVKLDKDELKRIIEETEERLEEGENEEEEEQEEVGELDEEHVYVKSEKGATAAVNTSDTVKKVKKRKKIEKEEDIVKKYGLEEYDEEEAPNPLKGIGNLTYYADEEDDPYITLKGEVKLDKDELKRIIEETEERLEEGENEEEEQEEVGELDEEHVYVKSEKGATAGVNTSDTVKKVKKRKKIEKEEDIVKKYGLEEYDEEEAPNPLKGIGNLTYYADEEDDPYITLKGEMDSDEEDFEIKPTDNLILVARAEKDACTLEVYVYNEDLVNLYVHHDIILPSFPLALEWLNYDIADGKAGNFVAVGSMEPTIDIWDIDLVDSLEPVATLGTRESKKKKKKKGTLGHTDAVLDLSWNPNVRHALASASADCVVGLWDLSEGKMVKSIKKHEDKVQCVRWHPFEPQSLLSGSFDHTVNVFDCRSPDTSFKSWTFEGEVERVVWDHFSPFNFYASTDNGHLYYLDSRQDKPVFTLSAHNEAVTGISLSSHIPGLLVTTSSDRKFKVWDVMDNKPSLILEKDFKMGQLYCVDGCQEAPFVFAIGGEKDVKVWDVRDSAAVLNHFKSRAPVKFSMSDGTVTETNIAMDTGEDSAVAMETLSIDNTDEANQKEKKKKKKKKKRKPKNSDNL